MLTVDIKTVWLCLSLVCLSHVYIWTSVFSLSSMSDSFWHLIQRSGRNGISSQVSLHQGQAFVVDRTALIPVLKDLVLIPVRTTPWDSEKELDELYDVFLLIKDKWKTDVSCISVSRIQSAHYFILLYQITPIIWLTNAHLTMHYFAITFDRFALYS